MSKRAFASLLKGIEALTQKKRSQKRYILHISNPKLRRFFCPPRLLLEISEAKTGRRYNSRNFSVTLQRLIINKVEWILSTM